MLRLVTGIGLIVVSFWLCLLIYVNHHQFAETELKRVVYFSQICNGIVAVLLFIFGLMLIFFK